MSLSVRAASTSEAASRDILSAIKQIDPSVTPPSLITLEDRIARQMSTQVKPLDPLTLGAVAALILTFALAVSLRPALRAARVDLGRVLKEE